MFPEFNHEVCLLEIRQLKMIIYTYAFHHKWENIDDEKLSIEQFLIYTKCIIGV